MSSHYGRSKTSKGDRSIAKDTLPQQTYAAYGRAASAKVLDKTSILYKDFQNSVQRRKRLLAKVVEVATNDNTTQTLIKNHLLQVRQLTLKVIEDALELEYRSQYIDSQQQPSSSSHAEGRAQQKKGGVVYQLPAISSFRGMEDKEDLIALVDLLSDTDYILKISNIRVLLPVDFPETRNPFMLGMTVDVLADMTIPTPKPGEVDEELKVLELMRYKRASKAILKAEAQILNRMPINLSELEALWIRKNEDVNSEHLIRAVVTFMQNNQPNHHTTPADFSSLVSPLITMQPHEFLIALNNFRQDIPMRVEIQAGVRKLLRDCNFNLVSDPTTIFLLEWVNSVLQTQNAALMMNDNSSFMGNGNVGMKFSNSFGGTPLNNINEDGAMQGQAQGQGQGFPNNVNMYGFNPYQQQYGDAFDAEMMSQMSGSTEFDLAAQAANNHSNAIMKLHATEHMKPIKNKNPVLKSVNAKGLPDDNASPKKKKSDDNDEGLGKAAKNRKYLQEKMELDRRIKGEIEKAFKEYGIENKKDSSDVSESQLISSMRYELLKLQQELLRRQVLDPRHYQITSVDITATEQKNQAQKMLQLQQGAANDSTGGGGEAKDNNKDRDYNGKGKEGRPSSPSHGGGGDAKSKAIDSQVVTAASRYLHVLEKEIKYMNRRRGVVDISFDFMSETLMCKLSNIYDNDEEGREINIDDVEPQYRHLYMKFRQKDTIAFMKLSKLIYNRATGFDLEKVIDPTVHSEEKINKMAAVIEQLEIKANEFPQPSGKILFQANRLLYTNSVSGDGAIVDLLIKRDEDCEGLSLVCTPMNTLPGQTVGPITIHLSDKELQVLLINQRGLYMLSKSKWSCMQMVAQWLSTRVKVKRIRLESALPPVNTSGKKLRGVASLDDETSSVISALSEGTAGRRNLTSPIRGGGGGGGLASSSDKEYGSGTDIDDLIQPEPLYKNAIGPQMIHVSLDRNIEVAKSAFNQWKMRNTPQIANMDIKIIATQDQNMLKFEVVLILPNPLFRERKKRTKMIDNKLIEYSDFEDSEYDLADRERTEAEKKAAEKEKKKLQREMKAKGTFPTVELSWTIILTSTELSVFGVTDSNEEQKVSLTQNKSQDENFPSMFMWKLLSRLHCNFKGKVDDPWAPSCNADDRENWDVRYDRRIIRDIRSISGGVMQVTVTAVGNEIMFEADPTDNLVYRTIKLRTFSETELNEFIDGEGLPLSLCEYSNRITLAARVLEKIKVVDEYGKHKLELYNYPERRMLVVIKLGGMNKPDIPLGTVEINDHLTLNDLRTLIRYELDRELVPKVYKFQYKGVACATRQEPFRRAWETLPKCYIVPTIEKMIEKPKDESAEEEKKDPDLDKKKLLMRPKKEMLSITKDQRRVNRKLNPVPLPTLCRVQDGTPYVYLLHDGRALLEAGDVIRIGSVKGRDYVVSMKSRAIQNNYPKVIVVEPLIELYNETDYGLPLSGVFPFPTGGPVIKGKRVLKPYEELDGGFHYSELPDSVKQAKTVDKKQMEKDMGVDGKSSNSNLGALLAASLQKKLEAGADDNNVDPDQKAELEKLLQKQEGGNAETLNEGEVYFDLWIWKCIPTEEDSRSRLRRNFDDGNVKYEYTYQDSREGIRHFHVTARFSTLEVLCTDARCHDMSLFGQRVNEIAAFDLDYYVRVAFKTMCDWFPAYNKGIDQSKFMKFARDCKAFPDFKKPTRTAQIEVIFTKETTLEHAIAARYITIEGFIHMVQELALIRFPPGSNRGDMDDGSVGQLSIADDLSVLTDGSQVKAPEIAVVDLKPKTPPATAAKDTKVKGGKKGNKTTGDKSRNKDSEKEEPAVPFIDPEDIAYAYRRFVMEYLCMHPDWVNVPWTDAKMIVMKKEAVRYCAATRIMTMHRKRFLHNRYTFFRIAMIKLQAQIRRRLAKNRVGRIMSVLMGDWLYRLRHRLATRISAMIRRYLTRCWYYRVLKKIREQQVIISKAKRMRMRKLRANEKKQVIYKEVLRVNGFTVMLQIKRKDNRNYSKDFGVIIHVYLPEEQKTHKVIVEEEQLRKYMQIEKNVDVLGVGELLDKSNLKAVTLSRLIIQKSDRPGFGTRVKFSKQAIGERGKKVVSKAKRIGTEVFIVNIFETGAEISAQCYHPLTSKIFYCKIFTDKLHEWVLEDFKMSSHDELQLSEMPDILKPGNSKKLYKWAIERIVTDTRRGVFKVNFEINMQKSKKKESIIRIQGQFRRIMARKRVSLKLNDFMMVVKTLPNKVADTYYLNRRTGASSWAKPKLLGGFELPDKPTNNWFTVNFIDAEGKSSTNYVNPWSGKYTHLSMDKAARLIQGIMRNHLLKPLQIAADERKKVSQIYTQAHKKYAKDKRKLANVINYAVSLHLLELDEEKAKDVYFEAVQLSEANPILTRALAVYMLGTLESPLVPNRERAMRLFSDADRRDESREKFNITHAIFKFACLKYPRNAHVMLNRAMCECFVYQNLDMADKFFRRALALAPFDPRVMSLWEYVKNKFPDKKQLYYSPSRTLNVNAKGPKRVIHGRPVSENPAWAGWVYVDEDPYKISKIECPYWYNPADGSERPGSNVPDFPDEWAVRLRRSEKTTTEGGLEIYYDKLTSAYFQFHPLSNTYQ